MSKHYDAFISYKHSDLDTLVAVTLKKELEKFRLPKKIEGFRKKGTKTRIKNIFRDRDELTLAAELSEPINEALSNSEYLIVICSPESKESEWCQKEIETFIKMHGREKVLAVLVDGEPEDAFADALTAEGNEPLAADVRGSSKHAVKKKIKTEVLRIAAVMFDCTFEELRLRGHEQSMRRRLLSISAIAAGAFIFAGMSTSMAYRINKQKEQINHLYQINFVKQAQLASEESKIYYNEGYITDAIMYAVGALANDSESVPEEVQEYVYSALSECLGLYKNGTEIRPYKALYTNANISDDGEGIPLVDHSSDYKYMTICETDDSVSVWNLETYEQIFEITDFADKYQMDLNIAFDGDYLLYYDADTIYCIDLTTGDQLYTLACNNIYRINAVDADTALIITTDSIMTFNLADGTILTELDSKAFPYWAVDSIAISEDGEYLYMGCRDESSYDMMICIDLKKNSLVYNISCEKSSVNTDLTCIGDDLYFTSLPDTMDTNYTSSLCRLTPESDVVEELFTEEDSFIVYYNVDDTNLILKGDKTLYYYSIEAGAAEQSYTYPREILNIYMPDDETIMIYYKNGICEYGDIYSFIFYENPNYNLPTDDYSGIYVNDYTYYTWVPGSEALIIYAKKMSDYATQTRDCDLTYYEIMGKYDFSIDTYTSPNGKYSVEYKDGNLYAYEGDELICIYDLSAYNFDSEDNTICFGISDDGDYLFIYPPSNKIQVISVSTKETLFETPALTGDVVYQDMGDYFIITDGFDGYVYAKDSQINVANINGFVGYDEDSNTISMLDNANGGSIYAVPFYGFDEVLKMVQ